jgi:GNAT superfamily N-acetyltransferase
MLIRACTRTDEDAVIALWHACGLTRPWNDPRRDYARKMAMQPELFLVGERNGRVVASVMAGYDGHRGWMNYLAVDPAHRGQGLGRALVRHLEQALIALGCPKLNLQIRADNAAVGAFYARLGYAPDAAHAYTPSACPGGRPPHAWLADGRSLFDTFGAGWTLLVLGPGAVPDQRGARWAEAAHALGVELAVVAQADEALRTLYEAPLALIRPDHVVAWRGHDDAQAAAVLAHVLGRDR